MTTLRNAFAIVGALSIAIGGLLIVEADKSLDSSQWTPVSVSLPLRAGEAISKKFKLNTDGEFRVEVEVPETSPPSLHFQRIPDIECHLSISLNRGSAHIADLQVSAFRHFGEDPADGVDYFSGNGSEMNLIAGVYQISISSIDACSELHSGGKLYVHRYREITEQITRWKLIRLAGYALITFSTIGLLVRFWNKKHRAKERMVSNTPRHPR